MSIPAPHPPHGAPTRVAVRGSPHRRGRRARRLDVAGGLLLIGGLPRTRVASASLALCLMLTAGCAGPPGERVDAHYPQGLHFYGDRGTYTGLGWEAE